MGKLLFWIARSPVAATFIGFAFTYLTRLMPFHKLISNRQIVAFAHPRPIAEKHLLIVPKKGIPSLPRFDLSKEENQKIAVAIFEGAQRLVGRNPGFDDWGVMVNVGVYQDVPQIHFHLIRPFESMSAIKEIGEVDQLDQPIMSYPVLHPTREFERVLQTTEPISAWPHTDFSVPAATEALINLLQLAQTEIDRHGLDRYTLITTQGRPAEVFSFRLVSGERLPPV